VTFALNGWPANDGTNATGAGSEPRRDARRGAAGFSGAGGVTGAEVHGANPCSVSSQQPHGAGRVE
jgi:hypothetical protein